MGRWLGRLLLALLFALLAGFAFGTVVRLRLERPVTYIGASPPGELGTAAREPELRPVARARADA